MNQEQQQPNNTDTMISNNHASTPNQCTKQQQRPISSLLRRSPKQDDDASTTTNHHHQPQHQKEENDFQYGIKNSFHSSASSHRHIQKLFIQCIIEFLQWDDQMYSIIQSITNLRERIYHSSHYDDILSVSSINYENSYMSRYNNDTMENNFGSSSSSNSSSRGTNDVSSHVSRTPISWKQHGYRHYRNNPNDIGNNFNTSRSIILCQSDMQVTIAHTIQHHERMIQEIRYGISSMNTIVEQLCRRYDDILNNNNNSEGMTLVDQYRNGTDTKHQQSILFILSVDDCHILLLSISKELYRKQMLVQQILNTSVMDQLLSTKQNTTTTPAIDMDHHQPQQVVSPIYVSRQCMKQWSWLYPQSYLMIHSKLIQSIVSYHDKKSNT